jgi:uncharacterized membrane protein HdeD (DUF308 family)
VVVWLLLPAAASAHVGRGPVVAVNDQARITGIEPLHAPFVAQVVDGDQALWVRLRSGHELTVLGVIGEPFLRISGSGVFVNVRSPTAQIDKVGGSSVSPSFARNAAPRWRRVASGRSYRWHDHRLHALASLGGIGPARRLGSWTIPLRLDGGAAAIRGGLWYRPAPDVWLWLLVPLMCVVTAVVALRSGDLLLARRVTMWLAAMGVVALVVARAGREFYGRPTPAVAGYVSFAIGVTVAVWALYRFLVRPTDYSWLAALVIGVAAAAEAAALLSMLYRPIVLAVFPAWFERACVALAFGAGVAATVLCVFAGLADTTQATEPKAEVRYAPL